MGMSTTKQEQNKLSETRKKTKFYQNTNSAGASNPGKMLALPSKIVDLLITFPALMKRVTRRGRVMLTGAQVGERFLGRVCVLSFRTRRAQMDACVEDIACEAAAILAEAEAGHFSAE